MAYTPTIWHNDQPPALSAANLNKMTDELESQAAAQSISHSLPNWVDGSDPALTTAAPWNEIERVLQLVSSGLGLSYTKTTWDVGWTPARNETNLNKIEQQLVLNRDRMETTPTGNIYWGARIDGQFYLDHYGSGNAVDAPFANSTVNWDLFEAHAGKKVSAIHWGGGGRAWPPTTFDITAANNCRTRGAFSNYSFSTSAQGINSIIAKDGTAQSYLTTLFTDIKSWGYPLMMRPFWEMNGAWYPWGRPGGSGASTVSDAQYRTLWQNLWQACADVMNGSGTAWVAPAGTHTGNVSFFWCPNIIDLPSVPDPSPRFPGTAYVDWLGWDGYAYSGTYKSPSTRFDSTYTTLQALEPNKPYAIGEMGVDPTIGSPGKAAWVTDFLGTWLPAHPKIRYFSWFNEYGGIPLPHIEVGDGNVYDSTALTAFHDGIQSTYFKANPVTDVTFPKANPAGSLNKVPIP